MEGHQLRRMRERAGVSRCYIACHIGMSEYDLSRIECGYDEVDESIVNGYRQAIEHVKHNSMPDRARFKVLWFVPSVTAMAEKW